MTIWKTARGKTVWRINIFALSSLQTRATVLLLTERSAPGPWLQRCSPHAQHAGLDAKVAVRMALTVLRRVDCAGVQQTVAVTVANMPSPSGRGCLTRIRGGMLSAVLLLLGEMAQVRGGAMSGLQSRNHPVVATAPTISVAGADFGTTSASFMVCARACTCVLVCLLRAPMSENLVSMLNSRWFSDFL